MKLKLDQYIRDYTSLEPSTAFVCSLDHMEISKLDITYLVGCLSKLTAVSDLTLSMEGSNINYEANEILIDFLQERKTLNTARINLRNNLIGNQGARKWATYLVCDQRADCINLSLRYNKLGDKAAASIANALKSELCCKNITLDLRSNNFSILGHRMLRESQDTGSGEQSVKIFYDERLPAQSEHDFFKPLPDAPSATENDVIRGYFPKDDIKKAGPSNL
jgi:hypothetical protein